MQLKARLAIVVVLAVGLVLLAGRARAQVVTLDTSHSVYYEAPTKTKMFVYTPSADAEATPWQWLAVRGGWEADVVSGASVSTKAGPAYASTHSPDVVTTASVKDLRNLGHGEVEIKGENTSITGGYAYGIEHDYRTNSLHVNARTDAYQHNTQFQLAYAHNWDDVCDRVQAASANNPTQWTALEDSSGCFSSAAGRTLRDIAIDTYEASWGQAWTPVLETQLTYTAQLIDGFQSDPYRSVILGEGIKAQEHVPTVRAREAVTARVAYYLRSIKAAIRFSLRGYHDTWAVDSGTAELEFEKAFGALRLMARGRFYKQSGAVFWSDDYSGGEPPLGPRGQYFTGDRELSPFWSWLGGLRVAWLLEPPAGQKLLGFMHDFRFTASGNVQGFSYDEYTLGGIPVGNAIAYIATASAAVSF